MSSVDEVEPSAPQNEVNEKPLIATGELTLYFSPGKIIEIDKLFGVVKKNNEVLQFRAILSGSFSYRGDRKATFDLELIYMSQEPIDCDFEFKTKVGTFRSLELGPEENKPGVLWAEKKANMATFRRTFRLTSTSYGPGFYFTIVLKISQDSNAHENAEVTNCARKFNDFSTSDFKVVCQDTVFHVHQWVLQEKSEYFAAILRNDFLENQNKELKIEDFEPKIIEMLLRYLYNGTISLSRTKFEIRTEELRKLMIIADKYDFRELFKTCDSYLAQWYAYMLDLCCFNAKHQMNKDKAERFLKSGMKLASEVKAPKLSAAIFLWKQGQHEFDELYSDIVSQYSDFAILAAKTSARKDYAEWIYQHKSWNFSSSLQEDGNINENLIAIIVGRFGENKGAVQCAPMHF